MDMVEKEKLLKLIETSIQAINLNLEISEPIEENEKIQEILKSSILYINALTSLINTKNIAANYTILLNQDLSNIKDNLPFNQLYTPTNIQLITKEEKSNSIKRHIENLENSLCTAKFNFEFFTKLDFFENNIVAIGANGSGKSSLSNLFKKYLDNVGIVISAQKVLIVPTFSGVSNFNQTKIKLQESQSSEKTFKVSYSTDNTSNIYNTLIQQGGEFQILLENLLAERSFIRNQFCDELSNGNNNKILPTTKLDTALIIWNSLIQHRVIECSDGINITLKEPLSLNNYPAFQMSDGEKVVLYLIAHVLQAPVNGFIVVDEPEMYLHKTILKKLWDRLEKERKDCIFVYLTHDLDFATSRTTAKKVWIKSFNPPNIWKIENIPENDLPQELLFELLGSRKNVLFCEGEKGSIDEKIYNTLLSHFTVVPVGSCLSVINYTKAFNKLPNLTTKAYGIIDSDHLGSERLEALILDNVFSLSMAEPENLFFDEHFLKLLENRLDSDPVTEKIKLDVIQQLSNDIELQISNYVSSKINHYFKESHVSQGNTLLSVEKNFNNFTSTIKIQDWYNLRKLELQQIIDEKDYSKALVIFNNKGLKAIANKHFKITNFTEKAIRLLQNETESHTVLKLYFPPALTSLHD